MKRFTVALLVLALALFVVGCQGAKTETTKSATSSADTASNEPIKIGAILSTTGPAAPLGEPERKALLMEVEQINKEGGVDGRQIELFIEDDQSDPKNANTAMSKLIDEKGVIAVIGGTSSSSSMAIKTRVDQAKIPQIALAAGIAITKDANDMSKTDPWVFRTAQSDDIAVKRVVDYLKNELGIKKFAIIHDTNAFGQSGADELQKVAPGAGLEIVAVESYKTDDTDMTSQLTKVKGEQPEVVVVWGTNPGPAIIAKNMRQLKMTMPFVGSHGIANKTFITLAGAAAEGVVFPSGKILVPSSATGEQAEAINAFLEDYNAKYGEPANHFAAHAYDAIHILTKSLKVAGTDSEKLRKEIENTKEYVGLDGIFNYAADNHDGMATSDLIMIEIKNGAWTEKK